MSGQRSGPDRRLFRVALPALVCACLSACGNEPSSNELDVQQPAEVEPAAETAPVAPSAELMAQWTRNCALCHVRGEGGAPVLGDRDAWAERLERGEDVLLTHTIEGLNNMPPLGYCMDCEEADFRALIRFMAGSP